MKKKIFGGIAILAIATIAVFNFNLDKSASTEKVHTLSVANIEALASENNSQKKCKQVMETISRRELCSYNPVKYTTQIGVAFSLERDDNGPVTRGKSGFEGTIWNDCAYHPNDQKVEYTASIVNC